MDDSQVCRGRGEGCCVFYVVVSFRYWELLCRFLLDHKRIGYDFEATRDVGNNLFEGVEGLGA